MILSFEALKDLSPAAEECLRCRRNSCEAAPPRHPAVEPHLIRSCARFKSLFRLFYL